MGEFLFQPMAMAVAFAMIAAYILSRTLVPACSRRLAQAATAHGHGPRTHGHGGTSHGHGDEPRRSRSTATATATAAAGGRAARGRFARWERMIDAGIRVLRHGGSTSCCGTAC